MAELVSRRAAIKSAVAGIGSAAVLAATATNQARENDAPSGLHKSFDEVGLPQGHGFPTLAYHPPTQTIIAHTRPLKAVLPAERLSFRSIANKQYKLVGNFPIAVSINSFVLNPSQPFLYFTTFNWKREGGQTSGDWDGLHQFNLKEHGIEKLAHNGDLQLPDGYRARAWLSGLFSVSDDGKALFCQAALETDKLDSTVDYWVAKLDLSSFKVELISKLEAVFA